MHLVDALPGRALLMSRSSRWVASRLCSLRRCPRSRQSLGATPKQVALAWLLQRSPNVLLIPGTSSLGTLRENLAAGQLRLSEETLESLDGIAATAVTGKH